ncbi:hypothetical protein A2U01_0110241, partial [Trifolium medium]|nr:hypothetical protein [Trifolium medium]
YTVIKDKLGKEIEDLKTSRDGGIAKLKKEYEDKMEKVKENYAAEAKKLK